MIDVGYFALAKAVSKYSDVDIKMGAVLCKHKPVGVGFNRRKTHTIFCNPEKTLSASVHCEASAILNTGKQYINNSIIYIYREDVYGNPRMARPCENCMQLLKNFGVKKIYYTIDVYPFYKLERLPS